MMITRDTALNNAAEALSEARRLWKSPTSSMSYPDLRTAYAVEGRAWIELARELRESGRP